MQSLGVVVFQALDYGLSEAEEQKLSAPLEELLEKMTGSESDEGEDGEDEGIEGDVPPMDEDHGRIRLRDVQKVSHVPVHWPTIFVPVCPLISTA